MLLRKRQDLTQADLAAKIDAGLAQVGRIERGEANFSISLLVKMAEVFGMSVAELVAIDSIQNWYKIKFMFEQTFKNIDDILYKDAGADSELDYIEQTS